jgi:predicted nucleic-acid-binding protein
LIGLDTNILLRYVVDDGSPQTTVAIRFVETELSVVERGYVSLPVFFEFIWTLRSTYAFDADAIQLTVSSLLAVAQLEFEDRELIGRALADDGQLPNALIGRLALRRGCARLVTFDKKFARLEGVELLA